MRTMERAAAPIVPPGGAIGKWPGKKHGAARIWEQSLSNANFYGQIGVSRPSNEACK
jgi:hypothetical protein